MLSTKLLKCAILSLTLVTNSIHGAIPLVTWNDTENRSAIIEFTERVTSKSSPTFVPPSERIAVFDNDGTLLCEKPNYTQMQFSVDQMKATATQHPEWNDVAYIQQLISAPRETPVTLEGRDWLDVFSRTTQRLTVETFAQNVAQWLESARHPDFHAPYPSLTYLPMKELIHYLSANDFQVYIVTGSSIGFMRQWAPSTLGIPEERIIGSRMEMEYENVDGALRIVHGSKIERFNIAANKPVAIHEAIGKKPIFAFGNSIGDLEMLEWASSNEHHSMSLVLLHDDEEREYAYDEKTKIYALAKARAWKVVRMKHDFESVFSQTVGQRSRAK